MYCLEGISVSYGGAPVLLDLSLRIDEGEQAVIIGQSGAGKSTLLRKLFDLHPKRAAFVQQDYALVPQLSTFHNIFAGRLDSRSVAYNLRALIKPREADIDEIRALATRLTFDDKLFERVGELSGGQQQRVAVARAIYRGSEAILGDEPVSSVDPHQAGAVLDLLKETTPTLILAMHDVELALDHFTRIIGLRRGRLVFDLDADKVTPQILSDLYAPC